MKPVSWRLYAPAQKQFYNKLLLRQNLTKLEMKVYRELFVKIRQIFNWFSDEDSLS